MSYTIKIIDNKSGVAIIDCTDAEAVIGSVVLPKMCQGVFATACDAERIAMGIYTAEQACDTGKKANPMIYIAAEFLKMSKDKIPGVVVDMSQFMGKNNGNDGKL